MQEGAMRKIGLIGTGLLFITVLNSGCAMQSMPLSLMSPPKMQYEQEGVKNAIQKYLPKEAKLTIPTHPGKASAINQIDLDGDGTDEIVAFYSLSPDLYTLGTLILKEEKQTEEDSWVLADEFTGLGREIDYVDFQDINGDGSLDLMVGWGGGETLKKQLLSYTFAYGKGEFLNTITYQDLAIGDMNADGKPEIAVIKEPDMEQAMESDLIVYQYQQGMITEVSRKRLAGISYSMLMGQVGMEKTGLVVDLAIGAHSAFTELLFLEEGILTGGLEQSDYTQLTFKPYPLNSKDINYDGVIEIGIQQEPFGAENLSMVETPWFNAWYRWDGDKGLEWVMDNYTDYQEGYSFTIPKAWRDRFTLAITKEGSITKSVDFYYTALDRSQKALFLSILYYDRSSWPDQEAILKKDNPSYAVLGQTSRNVLIAVWPIDTPAMKGSFLSEYQKLQLNETQLLDLFAVE